MVLPIGGRGHCPVVISMLNCLHRATAVAMAGFVVATSSLASAGALLGASGANPDEAHGRRHEPLDREHPRRRLRGE